MTGERALAGQEGSFVAAHVWTFVCRLRTLDRPLE